MGSSQSDSYQGYLPIVICRALKSDGEEIYRVVKEAFADYGSGSNPYLQESLSDIYQDLEDKIVLIIKKNERIVGSLRLEIYNNDGFYLRRFSILPEYQDQGLGTLLYQQAEEEVISNQGKNIYLHSSLEDTKLVNFYTRLGFKCLEKDNGYGYQRGLWVKRLKTGVKNNEIMGRQI